MVLSSLHKWLLVGIGIFGSDIVVAQQVADSNYVRPFKRENVIELYPGMNATKLSFGKPLKINSDAGLAANTGAYAGIYFNYKWVFASYAWNIPGTQLDAKTKLKYRGFQFRINTRKMFFRPFFDFYSGLLFKGAQQWGTYHVLRDMEYMNAGLDAYYFFNTKTFSYRAANAFSMQQLKSSGSIFTVSTAQWQRIRWKEPSRTSITDSAIYDLLASNPHWASIMMHVGYYHNFAIKKGKFNIAPALQTGGGMAKELNGAATKIQPVWNVKGWVNAGYNGSPVYAYATITFDYLRSNFLIQHMNKLSTDMMLTVGYRFGSLKKKIAGVL